MERESHIELSNEEYKERLMRVEPELKKDFDDLLTNGGIISVYGNILPITGDDFAPFLNEDFKELLANERTRRITRSRANRLFPYIDLGIDNSAAFYLIYPNAIEGLAYKEKPRSITPILVRADGSPALVKNSKNINLPPGFAGRTKKIFSEMDINIPYSPFCSYILKNLADEKGLGNIYSQKAQDVISKWRQNAIRKKT